MNAVASRAMTTTKTGAIAGEAARARAAMKTTTMTVVATDAAAGLVTRKATLKRRGEVGNEATTVVAAGTEIRRATPKRRVEVGRGGTMAEAAGTEIRRATPKLPAEAGKRGIVGSRAAVGTMTTMKDIVHAAGTMMTMTVAAGAVGGLETRAAIQKHPAAGGRKAIGVNPAVAATMMMTKVIDLAAGMKTMTTVAAGAAEDGSAIRGAIQKQHAGASVSSSSNKA
jgi:hypothetical protein